MKRLLLLILVLALAARPASAALAVDSQMPSNVSQSLATSTCCPAWTWSFTNTAGTILYCYLQIERGLADSPVTAMTATYNSVTMTQLGRASAQAGAHGSLFLFRLLSPATGSNTVSFLQSDGGFTTPDGGETGGCVSFTGNDPTTPDSGTGTAATANDGGGSAATFNVPVTSTTSGSMVVSAYAYGDPVGQSPGGTQTSKVELNSHAYTNNSEMQYQTSSGGTVTATYGSTTTTSWCAIAIEVKAAGGGGGGGGTPPRLLMLGAG